MRVRREVAQAPQRSEGKIRCRDLEREALADQPGQLGLMIKGVETCNDAAGAVPEKVNRQSRMGGDGERYNAADIGCVLGEAVDVEALAIGLAAAAKIHGIDSEA